MKKLPLKRLIIISLISIFALTALKGETLLKMDFEGNTLDSSGHNRTIQEFKTLGYEQGAEGQALSISYQTDNFAMVHYGPGLDGMQELYISVWARKHLPENGGTIIKKEGQYQLMSYDSQVKALLYTDRGSVELSINSYLKVKDSDWHHYELHYDGKMARLLVDSNVVDEKALSGTVTIDPGQNIYIGKDTAGYAFHGCIDSLEIGNKVPPINHTILKMDFEGSSADSSGYNQLVQEIKAARFVKGVEGEAADFSATRDNYLLVHHAGNQEGMKQLYISTWARSNDPSKGGDLIRKHDQYSLTQALSSVDATISTENGSVRLVKYNTIQDSRWHHYELIYDGQIARLLMDGIELDSQPLSGTIKSIDNNKIYIGKHPWGLAFDGQLDSLLIMNKLPEVETSLLKFNFDNRVLDLSGNNNIATWQGLERYAPGVKGQAIDLAPADDNYLLVPHSDKLEAMETLNISFWAKKKDPAQGGQILTKHGQYSINIGQNAFVGHVRTDKGSVQVENHFVYQIKDTNWHHYRLSYDGRQARLFIDGEEVAYKDLTGRVVRDHTRKIFIGKNPWGSSFNGLIDELEIGTNIPVPDRNLLLHLDFNDRSHDLSGRGQDVSWVGLAQYAPGKDKESGKAASISGAEANHLAVKYNESLDGMEKLYLSVDAKKSNPAIGGPLVTKHGQYSITIYENWLTAHIYTVNGTIKLEKYHFAPITNSEWHRYELSYDGKMARLYFDGEEIASKAGSGAVTVHPDKEIMIGKLPWAGGTAFNGLIDNLILRDNLPLKGELVAHYSFENNLNDLSGSDNGLSSAGTPLYAPGSKGDGVSFAAANELISNSALNHAPRKALTLNGWVKLDNALSDGRLMELGSYHRYSTAIAAEANSQGFKYWVHLDGKRVERTAAADYDYHDGKWHQLHLTYDGTMVRFYIDGVEKDSFAATGELDYQPELSIGRQDTLYGESGSRLFGAIDEVKLYNRALTPDEIFTSCFQGGGSQTERLLTINQPTSNKKLYLEGEWTKTITTPAARSAASLNTSGVKYSAQGLVNLKTKLGDIPLNHGALNFDPATMEFSGRAAVGLPEIGFLKDFAPFTGGYDSQFLIHIAIFDILKMIDDSTPNASISLRKGSSFPDLTIPGLPLPLDPEHYYLIVDFDKNFAKGLQGLPQGYGLRLIIDPHDPLIYIEGDFLEQLISRYTTIKVGSLVNIDVKKPAVGVSFSRALPFRTEQLMLGDVYETFNGHLYVRGDFQLRNFPFLIKGKTIVDIDRNGDGAFAFEGESFRQDSRVGANAELFFNYKAMDFDITTRLLDSSYVYNGDKKELRFSGTIKDNILEHILPAAISPNFVEFNAKGYYFSKTDFLLHLSSKGSLLGMDFSNFSATLGTHQIALSGMMQLPTLAGLNAPASVEMTGEIRRNGQFSLTGTSTLGITGLGEGVATYTLTKGGLKVKIIIDVPKVGTVELIGEIKRGNFLLTGKGDIKLAGFKGKVELTCDKSGVMVNGTFKIPLAGNIKLTGKIETNKNFLLTGSGTINLLGINSVVSMTLKNSGLYIKGEFDIPKIGRIPLSGKLEPSSIFKLSGSKAINLLGFDVDADLTLIPTGIFINGLFKIPLISNVQLQGQIQLNGDCHLTGKSTLKILGFDVDSNLTLTKLGLSLDGALKVPGVATVNVTGTIQRNKQFLLTGSSPVKLFGFETAKMQFTLNNNGLVVGGKFNIPYAGNVQLDGSIRGKQVSLTGSSPISLAGFKTNASFTLTNNGMGIACRIKVPKLTSIDFKGTIKPNKQFSLGGHFSGNATKVLHVSLGLTLTNDGINAEGSASVDAPIVGKKSLRISGKIPSNGMITVGGSRTINLKLVKVIITVYAPFKVRFKVEKKKPW